MPIIDDRTLNLNLPLPAQGNRLDQDLPRIRAAVTALDAAMPLKADLVAGKVPAAQLPSYVDDVLEYANLAAFPATGEAGKIYVAIDSGKVYRWGGSAYAAISDFVLVPATPSTLGGVKVGSGLGIDPDGVLYVAGGGSGSGLPVYADQVITPSTNGQTVFTVPGGYNPGQQDVWVNGVLLEPNGDDYTASNGTTFTTTTGLNTTDTIRFRKWIYLPASQAVNKTGDTMTGALNWAPSVDVASAATTQIGLAASNRVRINGTTAITSLGTIAAGVCRTATFAGALVLTHNATSLVLPGGVNITTAAGDVAEFESLGGGNWRCTAYMRANGQSVSGSLPVVGVSVATTGASNVFYRLDAAVELKMPAAPSDGDFFAFANRSGGIPTINPNGKKIKGDSTVLNLNTLNASACLKYDAANGDWVESFAGYTVASVSSNAILLQPNTWTAKQTFQGYTVLGDSGAPAIKQRLLTGTTPAAQNTNVLTAIPGIDFRKIVAMEAVVQAANDAIPANNSTSGGFEFTCFANASGVFILLSASNSANLLSRPFTILLTYVE